MRHSCLAVLLLGFSLLLPGSLRGQGIGVQSALEPPPLVLPRLDLAPLDAVFVTQPFTTWVEGWLKGTEARLAAERRQLLRGSHLPTPQMLEERARTRAEEASAVAVVTPTTDSVPFLPPLPVRVRREPNALSGLVGDNADLGIVVQGVGNLGGAWTRYKPCDPSTQFTCDPGRFPSLKPDVEVGVRVGGTISDRVHVDVDYDQTREFDAANNINVYYQGLTDEVLQRVEVGDVSIRLPSSRYLTRGVPAGNFGFMASGQFGPLDFQTVFAQQKGNVTTKEFKLAGGQQTGLEQDAKLVIDDADYVKGQFYFLVPPSQLQGYPHVDALALRITDAPASVRPGVSSTLQVYRDERLASQGASSAQLGYFLAEGVPPTGTGRHTGSFRRLLPEQDYLVHASGLWIMLRSPLRSDEALAVSFVTETGDTVGVMNAESTPPGVTPRLRLLRGPASTHQPGAGTWDMEMHQVYRLDSSNDVDVTRIDMSLSLGDVAGGRTFRDVLGQQLPFLKFFGLDEDAPVDRVDAAQVFQPARDAFSTGTGTPIGGTYIMFPTLRPFAEPAPVESERISAADLLAALGRDANVTIYDNPDPVNRDAAARFRLNFDYRVKVDGLVSSFSLGAFGIREGSERLYLGSRILERNVDYTIDYEIGTVSLNDAQNLFATNPGAELRATWEQKPLFSIAPTTVFGASMRYRLGTRGEINFVGLHQAEKALMSRPQLGVEPGSAFLGGVGGSFDLGGALLDRMVGAIPGLRSSRTSSVALTGEVAFSLPNPNRSGFAYLDDFEGSEEIPLGLRRQDWELGSTPATTEGDRGTMPFVVDASTSLPLTWQHDFLQDGTVRGALLPATHIDRGIRIVGNEVPEAVMWLTFGRGAGVPSPLPDPGDPRRWRSISTLLSTTGRDMTRAEYLEFYVSAGVAEPLALIFDIGTLGEDAFYVDSLGRTTGQYEDGRRWGTGLLDEEARLIEREVWGTDKDQRGLWDQNCRAEPLTTYPLGDPRVNCTRSNGRQDTEDLNGNGILDGADGQYFRYVVELDGLSEYLVRDTAATQTGFRLYRIPLRSGVAVNGANDGTWRFIRHLRMTVAGETQAVRVLSLARMRVVGSRWTKRDVYGIRRGMLEAEDGLGALTGEVRVGPVSALTDGAVYRGPPGVNDRVQDPTQQYGNNSLEINEKSLRLAYTDLAAGDRAEVYFRYPQQPRNMLMYRELRLWVVPRGGDWGPDGSERFTVRLGTDPNNFYLYQSPLHPATGPRAVTPGDWMPELVIDFQRWLELKAEAERLLIERGPRTAGVDTVWSADSAYAVVLEDRARAPNLAAVRELVFAVYNAGELGTTGEVWIDELRVGLPDTETGAAGNISLDMVAGDFLSGSITLSNQGALFRQLNETPSYLGGSDLTVNADARLDRLLPASWGIELPLSVSHTRYDEAPTFLQSSDVLAERLDGLREAGNDATRIGIRISKRTPTAHPLWSLLLDGSALRVGYTTATNQSVTGRNESTGLTGDLSYRRDLAPRAFPAVPGFVAAALRALAPAPVESSDAFRRLVGSKLRWSPASLAFGSSYNDHLARAYRFDRILALPGDTAVIPIESPRQGLHNDATLGLRPFDPLSLSFTLGSERDLLAAERASSRAAERSALNAARTSLGGFDFGWETARSLGTSLNYRPELTRWLRVGYAYNNRYLTDRNPSYLELTVAGTDTTAEMQRRFESTRQVSRQLQIQPTGIAAALRLDTTSVLARSFGRIDLIDFNWRSTLSSQFERETFTPGLGYQVGLGGFQGFSIMGADTAARAQQRHEFRAATGARLLAGLRFDVSYHDADTESFDPRGGNRTQHEVGWPKTTLLWRPTKLPAFTEGFLTTFGMSAGVQRIERTTTYRADDQQRGTVEVSFPLSLNLGLPHGFHLMYRGRIATGERLDPTGNSETVGNQHDVTFSGVIRLPESWRNRISQPISLQLNLAQQDQSQCRYNPLLAELEGCIAFLDVGTRSANLRIETMISQVTVGSLLQYTGRESRIGLRNGTSQFQLGFYGRFNLTAGQLPGAAPVTPGVRR